MSHTIREKQKLLARVRRVRGQVEAIERALNDEAGCEQVLRLIAGVRGAMAGLMAEVVEDQSARIWSMLRSIPACSTLRPQSNCLNWSEPISSENTMSNAGGSTAPLPAFPQLPGCGSRKERAQDMGGNSALRGHDHGGNYRRCCSVQSLLWRTECI